MNCIFCKEISDNSKSVEHILPESLGNEDHILKRGIVCDKCNNYFATKIEKVVLDKPYFKNVRHRNFIRTKKGRLVPDKVLFPHKNAGWTDFWIDKKGFILNSEDDHIARLIKNGKLNKMIIPIIGDPEPNDKDVSRFLAKVGLEFLAYKFQNEEAWIEELVNKPELDPIRKYARYGEGEYWEYHQRRIYTEEDRFVDPVNHPEPYEILHEFDFLYTESKIMYFVVVIMGIEYAINLGGSEIEIYENWLVEHKNISPIRRFSEYKIDKNKL